MHYIVEGNIGRGHAADHAREEEGHRNNRVKGDKMGRKHQGIGKSAAQERTPGSYQGQGGGRTDDGHSQFYDFMSALKICDLKISAMTLYVSIEIILH